MPNPRFLSRRTGRAFLREQSGRLERALLDGALPETPDEGAVDAFPTGVYERGGTACAASSR